MLRSIMTFLEIVVSATVSASMTPSPRLSISRVELILRGTERETMIRSCGIEERGRCSGRDDWCRRGCRCEWLGMHGVIVLHFQHRSDVGGLFRLLVVVVCVPYLNVSSSKERA